MVAKVHWDYSNTVIPVKNDLSGDEECGTKPEEVL
jgi:hypothetical protein